MNEAAYRAILRRLGVEPGGAGEAAPPDSDAAETARRADAFRRQADEWAGSGRHGVPLVGLPGVDVRAGACISCGEALAQGRTWRCAICLRAVQIVLGLGRTA